MPWPNQYAHLLQLLGGRRTGIHLHRDFADPVVAYKEKGIHSDAVACPIGHAGAHLGTPGAVKPQRNGSDSLKEEGACITSMVGFQFGVRVHVDEAGSHDEAGCVRWCRLRLPGDRSQSR